MPEQNDLRIVGVQLIEASLRTHRVLNNLDPERYPVMITLSRPTDPWEAKYLRQNGNIVVGDHDPMEALILDTSIDALKISINEWNGRIAIVATQARRAREAALVEDNRMEQVAAELHRQVSPI
ncbi:MAG: hypothetical protein QOG14_1257 [Mycobacterium sp.]|jgi:hypothetical protein|nr:hypothetical protein [Mycobacterium sp.]